MPLVLLLSFTLNPLKVYAEIAETEINGELINASSEFLRDLDFETWQLVAYKSPFFEDKLILRVIGYPGNLRIDHPTNLMVNSGRKSWLLELISISKSDAGGLKEVIASIKGKNIYSSLKFESGVHRVQRVPQTETQGRVHTSAATVAVLPEAEELDVKIDDKDLRIDVFRSSGPGGQSVNTTDSAVRITHIPTGIVVSQQDEKSQIRNKEKGLKILRSRIYEFERQKKEDERSRDRKNMIGSGDRSERIRTYNYPQGRVTDHRINYTLHKLDEFMQGEIFDDMIENLNLKAQEEKLKNLN